MVGIKAIFYFLMEKKKNLKVFFHWWQKYPSLFHFYQLEQNQKHKVLTFLLIIALNKKQYASCIEEIVEFVLQQQQQQQQQKEEEEQVEKKGTSSTSRLCRLLGGNEDDGVLMHVPVGYEEEDDEEEEEEEEVELLMDVPVGYVEKMMKVLHARNKYELSVRLAKYLYPLSFSSFSSVLPLNGKRQEIPQKEILLELIFKALLETKETPEKIIQLYESMEVDTLFPDNQFFQKMIKELTT
jgi:flagellar motor switch/type III secretory pathway protein FliN